MMNQELIDKLLQHKIEERINFFIFHFSFLWVILTIAIVLLFLYAILMLILEDDNDGMPIFLFTPIVVLVAMLSCFGLHRYQAPKWQTSYTYQYIGTKENVNNKKIYIFKNLHNNKEEVLDVKDRGELSKTLSLKKGKKYTFKAKVGQAKDGTPIINSEDLKLGGDI